MGQCELEKIFVVPTSSTDKELGQVPLEDGGDVDEFDHFRRPDFIFWIDLVFANRKQKLLNKFWEL